VRKVEITDDFSWNIVIWSNQKLVIVRVWFMATIPEGEKMI
jgi:hypothetical protein